LGVHQVLHPLCRQVFDPDVAEGGLEVTVDDGPVIPESRCVKPFSFPAPVPFLKQPANRVPTVGNWQPLSDPGERLVAVLSGFGGCRAVDAPLLALPAVRVPGLPPTVRPLPGLAAFAIRSLRHLGPSMTLIESDGHSIAGFRQQVKPQPARTTRNRY